MTVRRAITALALCGMLGLAGCDNDTDKVTALDVGKEVASSIFNRKKVTQRDPAELRIARQSAEALRLADADAPLAAVNFRSVESASVLRTIETNGAYSTWAAWGSSDRRAVNTKGGIITSTRGLVKDLMSSDVDAVLDLVTRREEGTVQYAQRYLDGDFKIAEAKSTCTVSRGYDKVVTLATGDVPVVQMFSSCISPNRQFVDLYLVSPSGRILESRQWVGPVLGFAHFRALR